MTEQTSPPREQLDVEPAALLAALPAIGRLMVTANHLGATHERIGTVETVTTEDGWIVCRGAEHHSRFELAAIARIIVDRTSVMKDKAYPRIELLRADDSVIASVVGFEGLEPFDAALARFGRGTPVDAKAETAPAEKPELRDGDPGAVPFTAALGTAAVIAFQRPGFHQVWSGVIEAVKPAMGFINVMRPDFHLHLRAGAVGEWRETVVEGKTVLAAVDPMGTPIGLSLASQ